MEQKYPLADTYYHVKLVPKDCILERYDNNIDVYIKGKILSAFISDVFTMYHIKINEVNHQGFILG